MPDEYTREDLIAICEKAVVPQKVWCNRDSAQSQQQVGECWALLRAGCDFQVLRGDGNCSTNERTIWVEIEFSGFGHFEGGMKETETFYLPTVKTLEENTGKDWY